MAIIRCDDYGYISVARRLLRLRLEMPATTFIILQRYLCRSTINAAWSEVIYWLHAL